MFRAGYDTFSGRNCPDKKPANNFAVSPGPKPVLPRRQAATRRIQPPMANQVPTPVAAKKTGVVLNGNDVLLGRGLGASKYIGNERFRDLVATRKAEYTAEDSYNEKAVIAKEVFMEIKSRGGRFLTLASLDTKKPSRSVVENGVWEETDVKAALEKCKQALRERGHREEGAKRKSHEEECQTNGYSQANYRAEQNVLPTPALQDQSYPMTPASCRDDRRISTSLSGTPIHTLTQPTAFLGNTVPSAVDPRLVLFKSNLSSVLQQSLLAQELYALQVHHLLQTQDPTMPLLDAVNAYSPADRSQQVGQNQGLYAYDPESLVSDMLLNTIPATAGEHLQTTCSSSNAKDNEETTRQDSVANYKDERSPDKDREDAVFALSALAVSDRPRFTEQDEAMERAATTDDERLAALSDLFGHICSVSPRQAKRARNDLDGETIAFLVKHMRIEINRIPLNEREALVEAQERCRVQEFCDGRLEKFLRCEGMNTKMAAQRFVNYWECRRELFGRDKYLLPMRLSEALCDDLVALETGFYKILPHLDTSRSILPKHHHDGEPRQGDMSDCMGCDVAQRATHLSIHNTIEEISTGFVTIF